MQSCGTELVLVIVYISFRHVLRHAALPLVPYGKLLPLFLSLTAKGDCLCICIV